MTHRDIYTKFMIEYDKAQVTSSYPSLTEYEVATVLDKAYNALIAQKVTGNNYRRVPFEADVKAISDLQPLVESKTYGRPFSDNAVIRNQLDFNIPNDFLYYVGCRLEGNLHKQSVPITDSIKATNITESYVWPSQQWRNSHPDYVFVVPISFIPSDDRNIIFPKEEADIWYVADIKTEMSNNNTTIYIINNIENYGAVYEDVTESTYGNVTTTKTKTALQNAIDSIGNMRGTVIMWPDTGLSAGDHIYTSRSKTHFDEGFPYDREVYRTLPCQIVDFNTAQRFFTSAYNMPWIKNPVCYIHGDLLHVVHEDDTISNYVTEKCVLTYIKKPKTFVKDLPSNPEQNQNFFDSTKFELNDTS